MGQTRAERPTYSLVIPLYNEEAVLPVLLHRLDRLMERLDGAAEVILVDDGSSDTTGIFASARAKDDPRYRYIAFSRNFGQQMAMTAGMEAATGDAIIVMDADLQDPPEVVLDLVAKWREGYEVVYARRRSRSADSFLKRATARLFYKTMSRLTAVDIPQNVGDFRLVDRVVMEAFKAMPERDRFVRGMFSWIGFRQTAVEFERPARVAGETKYSYLKLVSLAIHGLIGFSDVPLRLALWLGGAVSTFALGYGAYAFLKALLLSDPNLVPGWTSLAVIISFFAGVNLITTGVVGLYIGRIHNEVKGRPLYVVSRRVGFPEDRRRNSQKTSGHAPARTGKAA